MRVGSKVEANAPWQCGTPAVYLFVSAKRRMLAKSAKLRTSQEKGGDCLPMVIKKTRYKFNKKKKMMASWQDEEVMTSE